MKEKEAGWERIAGQLIQDLRNGKYSPGDKLPSENKLAGEFQVPRSDVRRAYSRLKELGYIYSLQGYGSFFAGKKEKIPLAMVGRTSFSEKMKELGIPFRSENIRAKRISYNPSIYESLGLPEEEPVWKVSLLRIVDGAPAAVYTRYLPERYFPHLPEDAGSILSFHAYLRENGHERFHGENSQMTVGLLTRLEQEGRRYFLKYAGARPLCFDGEPSEAVRLLEKSAQVIRDLAHPALLPLLWDGPVAGGYALLFPWTDALCMGKQYPTRAAFLSLPVEKKLAVFQAVLAFHRHVAERGYVSVDFYDGCVMYEEETGRPLLCDVDAYHRTPFFNPVGRMWGSSRFMAPEEYQKGAPVDERTMVYTMGSFAFELFSPEGGELSLWPLSPAAWKCAGKAASSQRENRYPTLRSLEEAWDRALGRV